MKILLTLLTALTYVYNSANAQQQATIQVVLRHSSATSCNIWIPERSFGFDYLKKGSFDITLKSDQTGFFNLMLNHPLYAYLILSSSNDENSNRITYKLYLSPGDNIIIKADLTNNQINVSGKGSNNNQPLLATLKEPELQSLYGDTLPRRVVASIKQYQRDYTSTLNQYIKTYKPSADFVQTESLNAIYAPAKIFFDFKENNKYQIQQTYTRNQQQWQYIQDSLFNTIKLDNSKAIIADNYQQLLRTFLLREKERLWQEAYRHPVAFYKEWYNTDTLNGKKMLNEDQQNLLQEKIINKYFTNSPSEFLYAALFDNALNEDNPKNLVAIFNNFTNKFPNSKYINWYRPAINIIREKQRQPLSKEMVFLPDNGSKISSFNELLALAKGKTVLLDMWGTWCGPCRKELSNDGPAIKAYFKGKGLDYMYVANRDADRETEWKKLIAYFDMKGTHILASTKLTYSIMTTVHGQGYPTYVIIKKDGTWELSKAGYPMNREVLIKQIDAALTVK